MSVTEPFYSIWDDHWKDDIDDLHNYIENNFHKYEEPTSIAPGKVTTTKVISWKKLLQFKKMYDFLDEVYWTNQLDFGYNLTQRLGISPAIYNVYDSKDKGKYDWHIDSSGNPNYDVKLTLIINLSKEYTGGDFQLKISSFDQTIKEFIPGSAIMFRSPTLHRVTPVLTGVRRTLTLFLEGPRWV